MVTLDMSFDPDLADGQFHVRDREGQQHLLPGMDGFRLMEIMRDFGLPIPALCGGACACGTCHIYVDVPWLSRLPKPRDDEEAMLDQLVFVRAGSRLACQILWNKAELDALSLTLAPLEDT
jgi:ferredoxin, 2Fe-2S